MLNIKKFLLAIGLIPKPTSEIDSQGELEVLNTDGKLRYHDGTSVSPVVTESHAATLSNKELTSPVINTSVSGTAIDTDDTLAANSDTKLASQKAVKTYVDNTSGVVANDVSNLVTLTGVPVDSTTLGTFTGTTIPDNQNVKESFQALESAHESHTGASTDVHGIGVGNSVVGTGTSQALTNKTIDVDNNTVSNIETDNLKAGVLNTDLIDTLNENPATDTQLPSALAVKTYVDNSVASKDQASEISYDNTTSELVALNLQTAVDEVDGNVDNLVSLSGVALDSTNLGEFTGTTIPDNQTVKQALQSLESAHETHTGASTNVHGLGVGSSVVGTTDSQALTNKTLTGAVINGSTKISAFLLEESEDNSQSGSLVTLTGFTKPIVRLTNASLVSVTGLSASEITGHGGVLTLVNATGNKITIINNAGTATEAILTGNEANIDLAINASLILKYDTVNDKWRVIGGTGVNKASEINYTPSTPSDWTTTPDTTSEALDELAARITAANGEVVLEVQSFSGDALQTVFTLSPAPASGDSFLVFIDGVYQLQSSYSYVSPNITFTSAPPTGTNNIEVRVASADLIVNGILPTTTKGDLVVHDGIQNVRLPVGGTEGQVLSVNSSTSTGLEWATLINFLTNAPTKQTFTTNGTWTKPVGCKAIIVELQGGGGGGSNFNTIYNSYYYIGIPGYPGQYAKFLINNPDASYAITIGGGGAAAISGTNAASSVAGGTTSFGAYSVAGGSSSSNSAGYTNQTTVPHTGKNYLSNNTSFPNLPTTGIIETYHIDPSYQGWYVMDTNYFLQSDGPPTKFGRGGGGGQSTTTSFGSGSQAPATSYGAGGGNATAGRSGIVIVHEFY